MNQQELTDRLLKFSVSILSMSETMVESAGSIALKNQIVRSATAPTLLYAEACAAESIQDFIHKMSMALKELRETKMALRLILMSGYVTEGILTDLIDENDQLTRVFWKSIDTAKRNRLKRNVQ